ncbi:hypothetical protein ECSTECMHI813_1054 [Escherichia coli STEC_MHI813]|nr:hypothetical protein ECSTECMHI813_1054 [Escherichia coli STEC_MHI813]
MMQRHKILLLRLFYIFLRVIRQCIKKQYTYKNQMVITMANF